MSKPTIPGPDRNTRTPKFRLPPLACDAHTHIFGPGDKYPYAPGRPYTPPDAPFTLCFVLKVFQNLESFTRSYILYMK